jgi:hypothetical protein
MADGGPDDVDLIETTRIVCQHGAINEFTVRSTLIGRECKITVSERLCEACLGEMGTLGIH